MEKNYVRVQCLKKLQAHKHGHAKIKCRADTYITPDFCFKLEILDQNLSVLSMYIL